jgi:hypothetical protein
VVDTQNHAAIPGERVVLHGQQVQVDGKLNYETIVIAIGQPIYYGVTCIDATSSSIRGYNTSKMNRKGCNKEVVKYDLLTGCTSAEYDGFLLCSHCCGVPVKGVNDSNGWKFRARVFHLCRIGELAAVSSVMR